MYSSVIAVGAIGCHPGAGEVADAERSKRGAHRQSSDLIGLCIAIDYTSNGACWWQWDDSADLESYLLGCPEAKIAVVILINSSHGRMVAREVAAKALGE